MDKRRQNGGHSTKTNGVDKRKNEYRNALELAATIDNVVEVLKSVYTKATTKQDMAAAKLFLEYYLGKPKESVDIHTTGESSVSFNDLLKAVRSGTDK
jgi:hypothetical protein